MNHLYIIQLQVSGRNITHPPSPIIFNSKYDLKSLKQGNPSEYIELLSSLLIGMDVCRNKNTHSVKFLECHVDDKGRGRYFDKAHTANSIKGILKTKTDTVLEVFVESDDLTYLINEPASITQRHFDAMGHLVPNSDKTALFEELIDHVLNEDVTLKPNADELAKSVLDKTLCNADVKFMNPIYINELGELIVLGEVAISKKPNGELSIHHEYGKIILTETNALPISMNYSAQIILQRFAYNKDVKDVNISDFKKQVIESLYSFNQAKDIVDGLNDVEIQVLLEYWALASVNDIIESIKVVGISRVWNHLNIKLKFTPLEREHRWLMVNLVNGISQYIENNPIVYDHELLPLIRFINQKV